QNSSNSQRLRELACETGKAAYLIDGPQDIDPAWFHDVGTVLVTAGASAPESVVEQCIEYMQVNFQATVEVRTIRKEEVHFPIPKELRPFAQA
ncbi:MAG: 4-hydroxy-3-methylbut-2-enyl diphosphate reductase, partial [Planctomycetota bacterium]